MNFPRHLIALLACIFTMAACDKNIGSEDDDKDQPDNVLPTIYAKGADISWLTQMEEDGQRFYNSEGTEKECIELMKELGFNSIRLRVWVNPEDGWCSKEDVLEKASRAYNLGMKLMIDFHYSDTWADPGNQNPPEAWKSFTATEMATALAEHTSDILRSMKNVGIDVEWVQIGNEVNSGMLHPLGKVEGNSAADFVEFLNTGYKSVKEIYPEAKVILHVSNGHDAGLFDWFFSLMKKYNAEYDIIGMSLYPVWWENGGWNDWAGPVNSCISNIKTLVEKFGKSVMICETGFPVSEAQMAKQALRHIINETCKIDGFLGVFYWEPQTDGVWKPAYYNSLGWKAYDKGAFKDGKATIALDPFKN